MSDGLPIWNLEASPDGRTVAAVDYDGQGWLWDADTLRTAALPAGLRAIAWRPDGQQIVATLGDSSSVQIFDRSGSVVQTIAGDDEYEALWVDMNGEGVVARQPRNPSVAPTSLGIASRSMMPRPASSSVCCLPRRSQARSPSTPAANAWRSGSSMATSRSATWRRMHGRSWPATSGR